MTGILVILGALLLAIAFPRQSFSETLRPVFSLLDGFLAADTVVLSWVLSAVIIHILLSVQPLVRRLSTESIPNPPAGTWRHWSFLAIGLMVLGWAGMLTNSNYLMNVGLPETLEYWVGIYILGTMSLAMVLSMTVLDESNEDTSRTFQWRYFSLVLSSSVVAGLSCVGVLLLPTVPLLGFTAPVVAGVLAIIFSY
ncbi:hypothetical protein [Natronoglomus mannanivorans]|uniref:Uncharacterized protein n=1 Tax=Natronoglomus mannanivorans TaxID=2979990 RepID=A0AAP3E492_9EURY|nr:hypothetical protein [Halobacteria archaeon AArc-xg1-1]